MSTIWLTYNPDKWPREQLVAMIARHEANRKGLTEWWRCCSFRSAKVGDCVFLFKQNTKSPRGIFGHGVVVDGPEQCQDLAGVDGIRPRVGVCFTELTDPAHRFLLPLDQIRKIVPESFIRARQSGLLLPESVAEALMKLF